MKIHMRWMVVAFSLALMATGAVVFAQDKQQQSAGAKQEQQVVIERTGDVFIAEQDGGPPMPPPRMFVGGEGMSIFVASEMGFGGKVVKGAPYSAQAVTETVQTLADGNRIVRKTTASVYRDGEGRTRQDQTVGNIGPYAIAGKLHQTIFINDTVSGTHYILEPDTKTARKMSLVRRGPANDKESKAVVSVDVTAPSGAEPRKKPMIRERTWVGGEGTFNIPLKEPKVESLGKQVMDGIEVEGTRETVTIAAGEIGNDLPINIVSERWYSPELQVVVMSKHTDPRMGENTYRLTGINRSEPSRSLFELPSDYTVKEMMSPDMRFKIEREIQRSQKKPGDQ